MTEILNSVLPWDNTDLGIYDASIIHGTFSYLNIKIQLLQFDIGIIYCVMKQTSSLFPCIVEDIKRIFGINVCGMHRITIESRKYLLINIICLPNGTLIYENSLNKIKKPHPYLEDDNFKNQIRELLLVSDLLSLTNLNETMIKIRIKNDTVQVYGMNELNTTLRRIDTKVLSIIPKTMYNKWFDEEVTLTTTAKKLIEQQFGVYDEDNIHLILDDIREYITHIVNKYDNTYAWYGYTILEKLSKLLQ